MRTIHCQPVKGASVTRRERVSALLDRLPGLYPDARCLLDFDGSPAKLLIATILAAQTTDAAVNMVTPVLWETFPDIRALASADSATVEEIVHSLGFYRNKARSIILASNWLIDKGGVPEVMTELIRIPGVGRKTANVVLGIAFGKPVIIVDTHVKRLSGRLDLSRKASPDDIERDLVKLVPVEDRTGFCTTLGFHGRRICNAKKPLCSTCTFLDFCPRRGI